MMIETLKPLEGQMMGDKYNLTSCSKEELITLIKKLMNKLPEKEKIEFVLKWINAKEALMEAGIYGRDSFIKRVEVFCKECIDGQYYIEPEYDDYYFYKEREEIEDFSQSKWVGDFKELLGTVIMFARNKNYVALYKSFETLIGCLQEADFNEEIFAIDNPRDYIDIDLY